MNADGSVLVPGTQEFNQCGVAKWSCVTAPSRLINSTWVQIENGVPVARYRAASGTSMAGPHSAAALNLIMQRFPYMTSEQALYTMFTTGRQNATINDPPVPNPTAGQMVQVPDRRNGWHTVNLRDAFKGPGQLLGPVNLDTHGYSDVWSNDISDVAIRARRQENADEAAAWRQTKTEKGRTNGLPADASEIDKSDFAIGTGREQARAARVYEGRLIKRGKGTLFLTGDNTWHGESAVSGGKLSPGLSPEEAGRITDTDVAPGNVLHAGDRVVLGRKSDYAVTVRGDRDYTSVEAAGDVVLDGDLSVDVQRRLACGTVLTIIKGRSIQGEFDKLRDGRAFKADGHVFKVAYRNRSVTLTVIGRPH